MLILSDCLTEKTDEGCLKVANSLIKRIQSVDPKTVVVSYGRSGEKADVHLRLNRGFISRKLFALIKRSGQPVLYIPFASNTAASALRTVILSFAAKGNVRVLFALRFPMGFAAKALLRASGAEILALSRESFQFYQREIGKAVYLKTGVDTSRFVPASTGKKQKLREKYKAAAGKKVLLHVGHLKKERNIEQLLKASSCYHVFLVVSSVTEQERDRQLERELAERPYTTIIDAYLDHIEEVYQMADVYFFPVQAAGNCIDVPLSVLEAAACNIPVVTTDYGEMKEFRGQKGFYFLESMDSDSLNAAFDQMSEMEGCQNRQAVMAYDWEQAVKYLTAQ